MTLQKYPRTPHLPFSPGASDDDVWVNGSPFEGKRVVITEKMDGENTTMYRDHIHARSLDSKHHPSRAWVKQLHGTLAHNIPEGWRVCGENMYAAHSIHYENLSDYFLVFSVWDETNTCLSWQETCDWCAMLGLTRVKTLYQGVWDEGYARELGQSGLDLATQEGFVARVADAFPFEGFNQSVAKWVRKNHVQTDEHWMHKEVVPNGLAT